MIADDLRALPTAPLVVAEGTPITPAVAGTGDRSVWLLPPEDVRLARLRDRDLHPGVLALYTEMAREIPAAATVVTVADGVGAVAAAVEAASPRRCAPGPPPRRRRSAGDLAVADFPEHDPVLAPGHGISGPPAPTP